MQNRLSVSSYILLFLFSFFSVILFLSPSPVLAACNPGDQGSVCDTGWCGNGAVCAQGHVYCTGVDRNGEDTYGSCKTEVDNCNACALITPVGKVCGKEDPITWITTRCTGSFNEAIWVGRDCLGTEILGTTFQVSKTSSNCKNCDAIDANQHWSSYYEKCVPNSVIDPTTAPAAPAPAPAPAANTVNLSGRVTAAGSPIPNIIINKGQNTANGQIWQVGNECAIGTATTDNNGYFTFRNIPAGRAFCLRMPAVAGYNQTSSNFECQTAGKNNGNIKCGNGTTVDLAADNAYNFTFTSTGTPASTPTCTISVASSSVAVGSDVSLTYSGNANKSGTYDVKLYVEKADGTPLTAAIGELVNNRGKNYYRLDTCKSVDSASCNGSKSVSTAAGAGDVTHLPPGDYLAHCNAETRDTATQCSGNPFCEFNGNPAGTAIDCSQWKSCSGTANQRGGDVVAFTVTAGTVAPTNPPVVQISTQDTSGSATACNVNVAYQGRESSYAAWNGQCNGALQKAGSGIGQNCCEYACGADSQCDEEYPGQGNCDNNCELK